MPSFEPQQGKEVISVSDETMERLESLVLWFYCWLQHVSNIYIYTLWL
jgi:hypothetical protein